jgi:hypothetical protein
MPVYTIGSGGSYASIVLAIADPTVTNGDTLQLLNGYNEILTSTLTINKAVSIIGDSSNLIGTSGTTTDPSTMINITTTAGFVVFAGTSNTNRLQIQHLKTLNAATDRVFNSAVLAKLLVENCYILHLENGIVGNYEDLTFRNVQIEVSQTYTANNQNSHFSLTGIKGNFTFQNILFNAHLPPSGSSQTRFIILSNSSSFPFGNGGDNTVTVKNCEWNNTGQLFCGVFFSRFDNFQGGSKINFICENNKFDVSSNGGLSAYRFSSVAGDTNILNFFRNIKFKNCDHNANGIGMLSAGGVGSAKALGSIVGKWYLCNNKINQSINNPSYSVYHFSPQNNKIFGIQNAIWTNPFPTPSPSQPSIDCSEPQYLRLFENKKSYYLSQQRYHRF